MFSQLARGNTSALDVGEHLARAGVIRETMHASSGDDLFTFDETTTNLEGFQTIVASWTATIPYNEFTKPVLEALDPISMQIAVAISKITTLQSRSDDLAELPRNLREANELNRTCAKSYQIIKDNHGDFIEQLMQRYADVHETSPPAKRAKIEYIDDPSTSSSRPLQESFHTMETPQTDVQVDDLEGPADPDTMPSSYCDGL
jgi:hypothetical protein